MKGDDREQAAVIHAQGEESIDLRHEITGLKDTPRTLSEKMAAFMQRMGRGIRNLGAMWRRTSGTSPLCVEGTFQPVSIRYSYIDPEVRDQGMPGTLPPDELGLFLDPTSP